MELGKGRNKGKNTAALLLSLLIPMFDSSLRAMEKRDDPIQFCFFPRGGSSTVRRLPAVKHTNLSSSKGNEGGMLDIKAK